MLATITWRFRASRAPPVGVERARTKAIGATRGATPARAHCRARRAIFRDGTMNVAKGPTNEVNRNRLMGSIPSPPEPSRSRCSSTSLILQRAAARGEPCPLVAFPSPSGPAPAARPRLAASDVRASDRMRPIARGSAFASGGRSLLAVQRARPGRAKRAEQTPAPHRSRPAVEPSSRGVGGQPGHRRLAAAAPAPLGSPAWQHLRSAQTAPPPPTARAGDRARATPPAKAGCAMPYPRRRCRLRSTCPRSHSPKPGAT